MHYILLILISLTILALQATIFHWFSTNQTNNRLDSIINQWILDPIDKAYLVNVKEDCPEGTSEKKISLSYQGRYEYYCSCDNDKSEYSIQCQKNCPNKKYLYSVDSQIIHNFFFDQSQKQLIQQKVCISRIKGYSFAQKAPVNSECGSNEKYCSWKEEEEEFNIDYGYCIPEDSECYRSGVQIGSKNKEQLPLIDFNVGEYKSDNYNIENVKSIRESDLLKFNNIGYLKEQEHVFENYYIFQNIHMPRVEPRCRNSFKEALQNYIDPKGIFPIAAASLAISLISTLLLLFFLKEQDCCCKNQVCFIEWFQYCDTKKINKNNSIQMNICFIAKPIALIIMLILNLVVLKTFVPVYEELDYMIHEECIDQYIAQFTGFNNPSEGGIHIYNITLTYASLWLIGAGLVLDPNIFYFFKSLILFIYNKLQCSDKNKSVQIQSSSQIFTITDRLNNNNMQQLNLSNKNNEKQKKVVQNQENFINQQKQTKMQFIQTKQVNFKSQLNDDLMHTKQGFEQGNNEDSNSFKSINYQNYNNKESILPPEAPAPAPPEQSEKLSNSIINMDDNNFS